jgi:short-chain fatty acids transporter
LALAVYLVIYFAGNGLNLTLDIVNWTFLCLGLLLARSALHYVKLIGNASTAVGQIILQYPFYAGIMGMMAGTGLISVFAHWFTSISSAGTLGFWAFLSGGILNMFVPSGGGQWAIQGPIFIEAAQSLGTDPSRVVMGVAYGDQWTNMIQPFFTIPLLAIAGLHVRQIMGYTFLVLIVTGVIFAGGILLAGSGA